VKTSRFRPLMILACVAAVSVLAAGCSSSEGDAASSTTATTEKPVAPLAGPPEPSKVVTPAVEGPITTGAGKAVLGPPKFDLSTVGYTEEEFFISGNATSYTSAKPLSEDGKWSATTDSSAPYTSRVVVRRPVDQADFDGTVVVEWLNVSGGLDADPDWTYTHTELIRSGSAWVGVSAQRVGVFGGGSALGSALALKNADSVRYEPLVHPGDDYSYDIFSQAGAAVWFDAQKVLGGFDPTTVLAAGESQSAFRLTTYINAVAPLVDVFDGYLVHSRAAKGAPLATEPAIPVEAPDPTLSRTDLKVPVLVFSSETDLVGDRLGYVRARQPDTEFFAGWEVPGTAHADAYSLGIGDSDDGSGVADAELFAAMSEPPSSVYFGIISCTSPINAGPHTYVVRSALSALRTWAITGEAPAAMPQLDLDSAQTNYVRNAFGIAEGGIRTPQVDAPIATLSGLGQEGQSFCGLFGTTAPFTAEQLSAQYPDHQSFVAAWNSSLDASVKAGAILQADADQLRTVAADSAIGG